MSYRQPPHGSIPPLPPTPPPPLPPPLPPHILPTPPLPHQPLPPAPPPSHYDSAPLPPPIPGGPPPPPPPPPEHPPSPRLPPDPPSQPPPSIPSLMDLDFGGKASPSKTAPEQQQPSIPGRSHPSSVQELRPPGPIPAQTGGSPQHYGKDYERFEHVRDQPALVGHASSYQQGPQHQTYPPWQQQPLSQPQFEHQQQQQQSQPDSIHPWTRGEQNQDSASSYAHSHRWEAGGMEQNQHSGTSSSEHPSVSNSKQPSLGYGRREQEPSSQAEYGGHPCLLPWISDGERSHSELHRSPEHPRPPEQGQTPGYGNRYPAVSGKRGQNLPLVPSSRQDLCRQKEQDHSSDYNNRYLLSDGGEHVQLSAHRPPELHDAYNHTEERRPADYPADHYHPREFERTQHDPHEPPLGRQFHESGPYERSNEYRHEYDEQPYQRSSRPEKPALLATPPQPHDPADYDGGYRREELHVHENRFHYQCSPRRSPNYSQQYHHPDDYSGRSPLSEHWLPDDRAGFRDPSPQAFSSIDRPPSINPSVIEHRHPEHRITDRGHPEQQLIDHGHPDYREPDGWQDPGAQESDSGGFGSYREWDDRDLDRPRRHEYSQEGPLLRNHPYHPPPHEFQHDPHFEGGRFDDPRGHSPRPPHEGDASMYHRQPPHEDHFRGPYDEFHQHHQPGVAERVHDEIPPGAAIVGRFFRPEVKTVQAEKIFDPPGRKDRPSHIVIILRGLPGSGKSHIAKLIREKEVSSGGAAPRILSLDPYFMTEVEKVEKDPDTGRRVKKKVEEYEYDDAMEPNYRASLFKLFNKTLAEGFFPMIVVDATNHKVHHFDRFWSNAKMKGFEVYVVELIESIDLCLERNIHQRTREEIAKLAQQWEETPPHFTRLDVTSLLSDSNIDEVEMECTDSDEESSQNKQQDQQAPVVKSRWEDASEDTLDKLDGFRRRKRFRSESSDDDQELSLTEYLGRREPEGSSPTPNTTGKKKKRVRWADLEAEKEEKRKREIGFCIGSTWSKVSEEEAETILRGGLAASTAAD